MEPASYNLALPRSLYGDDINGNTHADPMTQSCHVQLGSSDLMSSSIQGCIPTKSDVMMMMTNSMITTNNGAFSMGQRGVGSRTPSTAWNKCSNNSEGM